MSAATPSPVAAIDSYIANARPFAQPVLRHLRETIHRAVPDVEEAVKWSRPFFLYRGVILGHISAFKEHCALGLWGMEMADVLRQDGIASSEGMGTFGKIRSLEDLPPVEELEAYLRQAAQLIAEGTRSKSIQRVAKPARSAAGVELPAALATALALHSKAAEQFARMSPSRKREYAEWIADAKRDETRVKRVTEAVAWIAEGKSRNWRHERPKS